jgi:4-amino-4-deoxy-L-arabinose transferase-like glycosyltransferase
VSKKHKPKHAPQPVAPPPPADIPASLRIYDRLFLIVLLIAAAVRLAFLGRAELWQDELGFINLSHTGLSPLEIWRGSWDWIISIGQLPLSFFIFNLCYQAFEFVGGTVTPFTPALARLPAVFFGALGVWSTYRLAARTLDLSAARLVAMVMAVFFFPVYYSREVYCYAQLIAITPIAVSTIIALVFEKRSAWKYSTLLFLCLAALLYTHLGALMIVFAMSVCILVLWGWSRWNRNADISRGAFIAGLTCGAALLAASPFILRFALYNKAHTAGADYSYFVILNDVVCKLFLGEQAWACLISWIVFLAGLFSLFAKTPNSHGRRFIAWVTVVGVLAIAWATHRSQYLSVRYFSPVSPLVLIVMAQGLHQLALWISRSLRLPESKQRIAFYSLAAIPLAVHAFIYTPALLRLTEKSVPFGAVAQWINDHLEPGTPYLMESAYEIRWVGGSYPTPERFPAAPFVHGSAPQDMARLHDRQIDFMTRFPEAPFIESAHHNWDKPSGLWTWPHSNFRQHVIVGNPERLKQLIRWGIYPGVPHEALSEYSYRIDIYHNTWDDIKQRALDEGRLVVPAFEGWEFQGQPVSQQETLYFRLQRGRSGFLQVFNISTAPAQGMLRLTLALPGPAGQATSLTFLRDNAPIHQAIPQTGQFVSLEIPLRDLPSGRTTITWQRELADRSGEGLILLNATWHQAQ